MRYLFIILGLMLLLASAITAIDITACENLNLINGYYQLQNNIIVNGTCMNVSNTNISLDCGSHTITGNNTGYGINVTNYNSFEAVTCNITNFSTGIYLYNANLSHIYYNWFSDNFIGIVSNLSIQNNIDQNIISVSNRSGLTIYNDYQDTISNNVFYNSIHYGMTVYYSNDSLIAQNDMIYNDIGLYMSGSYDNVFMTNNMSYNYNNGLYSRAEYYDNWIGNVFSDNGWRGADAQGYSAYPNYFTYNIVDNNGYDGLFIISNNSFITHSIITNNHNHGILVGGLMDVSNNQINDNLADGVNVYSGEINISSNTISDNHNYGIYATTSSLPTHIASNIIKNNIVYGIFAGGMGEIYDNFLNNTVNYYAWPGGGCSFHVNFSRQSLDCTDDNILGGICTGGNAYFNVTGAGKGYSDNVTVCAGNSSGICVNMINDTVCAGHYLTDLYPLAATTGSAAYLNLTIYSPLNNSIYGYGSIPLNFSFNASVGNATCVAYLDMDPFGEYIGTVNNNTPYYETLSLEEGIHNISVQCYSGIISDYESVSNITISQQLDIVNFTSPMNNTLYSYSPYLNFAINSSFASVSCLLYLGQSYPLALPPMLWGYIPYVANGTTYTSTPFSGITNGRYMVILICYNGTTSNATTHSNISIYTLPEFSTTIEVLIHSPVNNTVFFNSTIPINFSFYSNNMLITTALCDAVLDNNMPIGTYNVSVGHYYTANLTGVSNGSHNVSAYCYNGAYYDSSENRSIIVNPLGVWLAYPNNNSASCSDDITGGFSFLTGLYTNATGAQCGIVIDNESLNDTIAAGFYKNLSSGEFSTIIRTNLTTGLHNISAFCVNGSWSAQTSYNIVDIEPNCIAANPSYTTICNESSFIMLPLNITFQSQLSSAAYCGAVVDTDTIEHMMLNGWYWYVPVNTSYTIAAYGLTPGVHHMSVFCQNGTWTEQSSNITISVSSKYCDIVNAIDAGTSFIETTEMIKFMIGLLTICGGAYVGFLLTGSMGAVIAMVALTIILSVIVNFIPIWIAIVAIIGGILAAVYSTNR